MDAPTLEQLRRDLAIVISAEAVLTLTDLYGLEPEAVVEKHRAHRAAHHRGHAGPPPCGVSEAGQAGHRAQRRYPHELRLPPAAADRDFAAPRSPKSASGGAEIQEIPASALLAQLVEHFHGKEGVVGSSPTEGSDEPPVDAGVPGLTDHGIPCWCSVGRKLAMLGRGLGERLLECAFAAGLAGDRQLRYGIWGRGRRALRRACGPRPRLVRVDGVGRAVGCCTAAAIPRARSPVGRTRRIPLAPAGAFWETAGSRRCRCRQLR